MAVSYQLMLTAISYQLLDVGRQQNPGPRWPHRRRADKR
jgi:hypothetical protein